MKLQDLKLFVLGWDDDAELHSLQILLDTGDGFITTMDGNESYHEDLGTLPFIEMDGKLEREITEANGHTYDGDAPNRNWVNAFILANRVRFGL